jgi:PAS domain S-box-containing protein
VRETVRAGKVWRGEVANRRKDGSSYVEDITVAPVRDAGGAIQRYIAIRRDMTARHAANEAKAFLASIVESSEDAIVSSTPEGIILSWNRGAERLYGYRAEEAVGKPVSMLAPADQRASLKWIGDKTAARRERGPVRRRGTDQGRQARRYFHFSLPDTERADGQITARAAIMRDITARVQAQEARALLASIVDSAADAIFGARWMARSSVGTRAPSACTATAPGRFWESPSPCWCPQRIGEASRLLDRIGRGETISQLETVTVNRDGGQNRGLPHYVSGAERRGGSCGIVHHRARH